MKIKKSIKYIIYVTAITIGVNVSIPLLVSCSNSDTTKPNHVISYTKLKKNISTNGINADASINLLTPEQLCQQTTKIKTFIFNNCQLIFENWPVSLTETNIIIDGANVVNNNSINVSVTITNATLKDGTIGKYSCSFKITNLRVEIIPPIDTKITKIKQNVVENGINASNEIRNFTPTQLINKSAILKNWIINNQTSIFDNYTGDLNDKLVINKIAKISINSISVNITITDATIDKNGKKGPKNFSFNITGLVEEQTEPATNELAYYYDNFVKMPDNTIFVNPNLTNLINDNSTNLDPELQKQKELVLRYGTFPIDINLNDDQVTIKDLIKMFDIMAYLRLFSLTFGNRNIDAKLVSIALAQWWISRWKYFPYVVYNNPARRFYVKGIDTIPNNKQSMFEKTWYAKSTQGGNYANQWLYPNTEQKDFVDFVSRFLLGVDPNMSDIDKLFYSYMYVGSWINYGGGGTLIDTVSKHQGVCIQYATLLSFCLNLLGVPSIPMNAAMGDLSGMPPHTPFLGPHAITWCYLEARPGEGKKWHCSDATFGDINEMMNLTYSTWNHGFNFRSDMIFNLMFCNTASSPFQPDENKLYRRWNQYNNNVFFDLPFSMVYDSKYTDLIGSAAIGTYNFYDRQTFCEPFANNFNERSRFFYFDNEWYFVAKQQGSKSFGFYKGSLNNSTITDITYQIPVEIKQAVLSKPMLLKFGDYFIFNQNDESFRLHNMNSVNWFDDIVIPIDQNTKNQIGSYIGDFYVDAQGYINIYNSKDVGSKGVNLNVIPVKLNVNLYSKIQNNFTTRDKTIAKTYYDYLAGIKKTKLYEFDFGVLPIVKQQYYKDLETIFNDNSLTDTNAILAMGEKYLNLSKECFSGFNNISLLSKISTNILVSQENYNLYGYKFNVNAWSNPAFENIFDVYKYDIYYSKQSQNKAEFKPIASDLYKPEINKQIMPDPDGNYFIRVYPQYHKDTFVETDIINISLQTCTNSELIEKYQEFYANCVKFSVKQIEGGIDGLCSNFDFNNPNSYNKPITLNSDIIVSLNLLNYKIKWSINHINKTTKHLTKLDEFILEFPTNSKKFQKIINVNSETHGLYYTKIEIINKSTNEIVNTQYSKNSYLFTENDINNFNLNEWKELNKYIV